jgi:lipopolysaccharide/colanic/teichoic acid biosynthesis glycosyltransferase
MIDDDSSDEVPYRPVKRALDRAGSALLLLVASPVFVTACVAIAADQVRHPGDRGSWLYRERRISRGREFELLKFRVLREDVVQDARGRGLHARQCEADVANLTRAGVFLKRWYLDELPQLVNVLRGDLSLVGPRPWPKAMVDDQRSNGVDYRMHVVAGWTGPAQARKGDPTATSYTAIDLDYVDACRTMGQRQLLRLDLTILGKTFRTMLRGEGMSY